MHKRTVGKSTIAVTPLTLGCMSLGTDNTKAATIIDQAIDMGINHFDTADLYDYGMNEQIIGEAIKEKRDKLVLTSKVGNHFDAVKRSHFWDPSKKHIENSVKETLSRLQTDYLDFYLLHGGTIDDPIDASIEAFENLKQAGLIRAYGISSIRPNVIQEYIKKSNIDVVMMQYSLLDRRPEALLDLLAKHDISVFARGPLAKGLLTPKGLDIAKQKAQAGYLDYSQTELINTISDLQEATTNLTGAALHYPLQHSTVASVVFGASTTAQLDKNIRAFHTIKKDETSLESCKQQTKQSVYHLHT